MWWFKVQDGKNHSSSSNCIIPSLYLMSLQDLGALQQSLSSPEEAFECVESTPKVYFVCLTFLKVTLSWTKNIAHWLVQACSIPEPKDQDHRQDHVMVTWDKEEVRRSVVQPPAPSGISHEIRPGCSGPLLSSLDYTLSTHCRFTGRQSLLFSDLLSSKTKDREEWECFQNLS